jgi:RsiW-degrading membrane proteinase PrsW (M82 family)
VNPTEQQYVPDGSPMPAAPKRVDWKRILWLSGIVAFVLTCGIVLLAIIGANIGAGPLAIGFGAALLPVPFLIAAFMWLDRYEPEPTAYLAFCFLWGAFVAALGAYEVNTFFAHVAGVNRDVVATVIAPIIEESMKALGPVLLLWFTLRRRRPTFNGMVDAIVYFGMSAAGFAMSENILYLGGYGYAAGAERAGTAGGLSATIAVFIGRIPLTGFAHPLFTSMTALGVGLAIRSARPRLRWVLPFAGVLLAMTLHGSWNLMATLANNTGHLQYMLYGYFAVMMPIFFAMVWFTMWLRSAEGRRTQTALQPYVAAGWLTPPEVASLATIGRRRSARAWAKRVAGERGDSAMRGFQLAATRLSLLRDRIERHAAAGRFAPADLDEERQLLWLMSAYRSGFVGTDPVMPPVHWDGQRYRLRFPDGVERVLDPPPTPVVPLPIMLAAPPPPVYGPPGYGYR